MPSHNYNAQCFSTDMVCNILGILPGTLRNWTRAGLIPRKRYYTGYSKDQFDCIIKILDLSSAGNTLREIYDWVNYGVGLRTGGWQYRQDEVLAALYAKQDVILYKCLRQMGSDYCGDDFVNKCLKPLNQWLWLDFSLGKSKRHKLFHEVIVRYTQQIIKSSMRRKSVPLYLEAISVNDQNEIWIEAIRLTGQGFRVELKSEVTFTPGVPALRYEHRLMWCGTGISNPMLDFYTREINAGSNIMLCGPGRHTIAFDDR